MTGDANRRSRRKDAFAGPAERLLAVALARVANAVMITAIDGTIAWVNAAFTEMSGYSAEEAIGATPRILKSGVHGPEQYQTLWHTILAGEVWHGEVVERHKDGSLYTVLQTITPILDAERSLEYFVAMHQDVTALRQAEASARLHAQMLAAVGDAVIATDLDGGVQYLNPAAQRLFGWTSEDAHGRPITEIVASDVTSEDAAGAVEAVQRGEDWTGELRLTRADGSTFPALVTNAPYHDATGELVGTIGVARDISDLHATIEQLERGEQIRIAFLRATSHELRTPLSIIVGFADILRRHDEALRPDERRLYLDRLAANVDRLHLLIDDLLDLDRLSTGLVTANRQPHDLAELIARVAADTDAGGRHVTLRVEAITADVDGPKIERAVANVLANAVRHAQPGGEVHVHLFRDGDENVLRIEDDGPGIDPGYLPLIFEPFVQGPERHEESKPGTGLGLPLALEMVRLHDGSITASNRPEGGACFEVRIPDPRTTADTLR